MSSRVSTGRRCVSTPWYTITKPFWQKLKAVWLPYLLTMPRRFMPSRLHAWLNCWRWKKLARPGSDVALEDDQLYQEPQAAPVAVPMGKFAMYPDWQPDADFIRLAALWGVALREPVTTEELTSFIAYWQAEGKVFHHVQWATKTGAQPANRSCQQRRTAETRCEYGQ